MENQASDSRIMEYSPSRSRSDNSEGLQRFVAVRSRGFMKREEEQSSSLVIRATSRESLRFATKILVEAET